MHAPGDELKDSLVIKSAVAPSETSTIVTLRQLERHQPGISSHQAAGQSNSEPRVMEVEKPIAVPSLDAGTMQPQYEVLGDPGSENRVFKMGDFIAYSNIEPSATRVVPQQSSSSKKKENTMLPQPVAVGARTSKYTILLHEKYQHLGISQPVFTFGGDGLFGWTVEVSFPGLEMPEVQGIKEDSTKRYSSKQEAKEALCEKAFNVLEILEAEGKLGRREKRKSIATGAGADAPTPVGAAPAAINYIGQLLEYQRSIDAPQPSYVDYQSGTLFACLLTIEGYPEPFGDLKSLHATKKSARQDAARHAVQHFRAQGQWPSDVAAVGGIRKKSKAAASQLQSIHNNSESRSPDSSPLPSNASYAQQVAQLATRLSLPSPEYHYSTPEAGSLPADAPVAAVARDFHTVSVYFRNSGPHTGPWGTVRNVYGKKRAKEECARLALEYLKELEKHRMEKAARLVDGIMGGEELRGAVGRVADGEEVVKEVVMEDDDDGSDDDFADAMEMH